MKDILVTSTFILWRIIQSVLLYSCSDNSTDSVYYDPAGISISAGESSFFVTNYTNATIHYFAIEQRTATYTDWIQQCDTIKVVGTNSTKEIAYLKIYGYYKDCEVLYYWWHCNQTVKGELKPVSLHKISFKTQ